MPSPKYVLSVLWALTTFALISGCGGTSEKVEPVALPHRTPTGCSTASGSQVNLAWQDTSNELGYEIERKMGLHGAYQQIARVEDNVIHYTDIGLKAGATYYYRIRAFNASGHSAYSEEVCVIIPSD